MLYSRDFVLKQDNIVYLRKIKLGCTDTKGRESHDSRSTSSSNRIRPDIIVILYYCLNKLILRWPRACVASGSRGSGVNERDRTHCTSKHTHTHTQGPRTGISVLTQYTRDSSRGEYVLFFYTSAYNNTQYMGVVP